eukprot:GHVO01013240.1.p1 GENE.GHVO01013240.1~~GHVO01013240.1.p1  ORF type:complete len:100 (+),score=5.00 GHVO01013240.1:93-392(+)
MSHTCTGNRSCFLPFTAQGHLKDVVRFGIFFNFIICPYIIRHTSPSIYTSNMISVEHQIISGAYPHIPATDPIHVTPPTFYTPQSNHRGVDDTGHTREG